jgi:murein DD-endopeptidase MepM/ murein hydrolase activator NlpD
MRSTVRRAFAVAAITMAAAVAVVTVSDPAAAAVAVASPGPHIEAFAADDFVIYAFPNQASQVWFYDSWGAARRGGRRHRGTDIHSPKGSPVVAVSSGRLVEMGWNRLSGWVVKIDHGGGWVSAYVHLNNDTPGTDDGEGGPEHAFAPGLVVGSHVGAGQLIGYVGDSGNAESVRPHTHFELHLEGEKLNPFPYLDEAWRTRSQVAQ